VGGTLTGSGPASTTSGSQVRSPGVMIPPAGLSTVSRTPRMTQPMERTDRTEKTLSSLPSLPNTNTGNHVSGCPVGVAATASIPVPTPSNQPVNKPTLVHSAPMFARHVFF